MTNAQQNAAEKQTTTTGDGPLPLPGWNSAWTQKTDPITAAACTLAAAFRSRYDARPLLDAAAILVRHVHARDGQAMAKLRHCYTGLEPGVDVAAAVGPLLDHICDGMSGSPDPDKDEVARFLLNVLLETTCP